MDLKRTLAVWLILIAVEVAHGVARAVFLVPRVGDFRSRQIGVASGSALILLVAFLFSGWMRARDAQAQYRAGALWLVLTLAFELGFGHFVFGRSWTNLAEDYDLRHGGLLGLGLIVLLLAPRIAAAMRR